LVEPRKPLSCDLCGLPLSGKTVFLDTPEGRKVFCCKGCLQVYAMLSESEEAKTGKPFTETALFQKCREMGIIPKGPGDLEAPEEQDLLVFPSAADPGSKAPLPGDASPGEGLVLDARISGMWCPACAWIIEEAVRKTSGVQKVSCHFSTDRFRCVYDPVKTSPRAVLACVENLGYRPHPPDMPESAAIGQAEWVRMIVSAFLTMNVMMFSFALYVGFFDTFSPDTVFKLSLPVFMMAAAVLIYGGKWIFSKAAAGIRNAAFGMDTLIAAGAFTAFAYSTYNLARGSLHLYYDTAAMLITLVLIGKHLESAAKNRVQADLNHFYSLIPNKVRLCTDAETSGRYVSAQALNTGDRFRVDSGEIAAADGIILEGAGTVDESALTGEARRVRKERSDRLRGGSRILQGAFTVRAEAVGKEAVFGRMLTLMEEALQKKGPYEERADRILRGFVPGILLLAAGVGLALLFLGHPLETAVVRTLTIVVITCPCALGVAVPLARTAGASLMLKNGILLRDFSALDIIRRISVIVFDKTGTLTSGRWRLQETRTQNGCDLRQALSLAAALEKDSTHYIASEILDHAKKNGIEPTTVEEIRHFQNGVSGRFQGREVRIGSEGFVADAAERKTSDVVLSGAEPPAAASPDSRVYLSLGNTLCAVFVFSDPIKPDAEAVVSHLLQSGFRVVMVSGDNPSTTEAVAARLGIPEACGGLLPADKAGWVQRLRQESAPTAMVGDGINDAPAMVCADLGIAMYSESHLGKEAAHATLMRGSPGQLLDFMRMATRIRKKMHQNLAWAFVYNICAIPIAAAGLLTPIIAVCAMLASSLSVIGNTLLLLRKSTRNEALPPLS